MIVSLRQGCHVSCLAWALLIVLNIWGACAQGKPAFMRMPRISIMITIRHDMQTHNTILQVSV